jgi:hypothetical protein
MRSCEKNRDGLPNERDGGVPGPVGAAPAGRSGYSRTVVTSGAALLRTLVA